MTMIDISFQIFDELADQRVNTTADLIKYDIDRDGAATLYFMDRFGCTGQVMLSPSETNVWIGYKNADKLNGYWPKITEGTPLKEVKEIHQAIWDKVIKNGRKPATPYACNCAACEYVYNFGDLGYTRCFFKCPIAWSRNAIEFGCTCGIEYYDWSIAMDLNSARIVRDIPFKFELEGKGND